MATRGACVVQPDQRFEHVVSLVRKGTFGWADFFEPVMDSITSGGDYYLLANDFPSYIEAQVCCQMALPQLFSTLTMLGFGACANLPMRRVCCCAVKGQVYARALNSAAPRTPIQAACITGSAAGTAGSVRFAASTCNRAWSVRWCRSAWMRHTRTAPSGRACPSCPQQAAASSHQIGRLTSMRGTSGGLSPAMCQRLRNDLASASAVGQSSVVCAVSNLDWRKPQ